MEVIGVLLALASNALTCMGLLFQERSAKTETMLPMRMRRLFWIGLVLNVGSEVVLSSLALALAPLSLIAPIGASNVIWNGLFLHFGCTGCTRRLTRSQWALTIVLAASIAGCTLSGSHRMQPGDELLAAIGHPKTLGVTGGIAAIALALIVVDLCCWATTMTSTASAIALSSLTILSLKVTVTFVKEWVVQDDPPDEWAIFVTCAIALSITAVVQLYMLNRALKGDARFVLPTYMSMSMIGVIGYSVLLGEFVYDNTWTLGLFVGSVGVVIGSLFALQCTVSHEVEPNEEAHVTL